MDNVHWYRRSGFTLIELLVVIAIIAILAAILFPVFLSAKAQAREAECVSRLKDIGLAFSLYVDNWNGTMPSGGNAAFGRNLIRAPLMNQLKPYTKTMKTHQGFVDVDEQGDTRIPVSFFCPSFNELWRNNPWYIGAGTYQCVQYDEIADNEYPAKKLEECISIWNHLVYNGQTSTRVNPPRAGASGAQLMYCSYGGQFQDGAKTGIYYYPHNNGANCLYLDWHVKWNRDTSAATY